MALIIPNTFTSSVTFFATAMNSNFSFIVNALSDGTQNLDIDSLESNSMVVSGSVTVVSEAEVEGSLAITGTLTTGTLDSEDLRSKIIGVGSKEVITIVDESITPTKSNIELSGTKLNTIVTTNFVNGSLLFISKNSTSASITINNSDNIILGALGGRTLDSIYDKLVLQYIDGKFYELFWGDNA